MNRVNGCVNGSIGDHVLDGNRLVLSKSVDSLEQLVALCGRPGSRTKQDHCLAARNEMKSFSTRFDA